MTLSSVTTVALTTGLASPAGAVSGQALINGDTVTGSPSAEQTAATSLGLSVTVVSGHAWDSMTAADFAKYRVLIIGDPTCQTLASSVTSNRATWTSAVMATAGGNSAVGNRVVLGAGPVRANTAGANAAIKDGIAFAAALTPMTGHATGVYLDASCDGSAGADAALLDTLNLLSVGTTRPWTENANPPCSGVVSLIGSAPQFADLAAGDLQGWQCSTRESFPTFETDFVPLAIVTGGTFLPTCGTDTATHAATCGEAYFLAAGTGLTATTPDIAVSPVNGSSAINTTQTITATLTDGVGGPPLAGQLVEFAVTGANSGASGVCHPVDCGSDGLGHVTFSYTGTHAGMDTIVVSITCVGTIQTATAATTWTSSAADITVNPPSGTNPVNTKHTITATLTNGKGGPPLVGVLVKFMVNGANPGAQGTCVPAGCKSDSAGKVTFTYTGTHVGNDMITASITVHGSTQSAIAAKTWTSVPPAISLTLKTGLGPINTMHTVTATLTQGPGGPPLAGQVVKFTVEGANAGAMGTCVPAGCKSDRAGKVTFTYTGTHTGNDTIRATIVASGVSKTDTAAMTWTAPAVNSSNIFQVELRSCVNLHVGYNFFPAGTVVHWTVSQRSRVVATKQFTALGGGKTKNFLTQSLGVKLQPNPDGLVHFQWVVKSTTFSYTAPRSPGC